MISNEPINNELFKFKGTAKRTTQLSFIVLVLSLGIATYYYFLGLKVSALMVGCFSFCVLIILLLQLFHILQNVQVLVLSSICILLIVSSFIEGSGTGQYFYFFPIIIVIPIVVNYKKSSYIELGTYFLLGIGSFGVNFYVGHFISPFEYIPANVAEEMLFTNAACSILLTLCFAIAYIYYELKYIKALVQEKNSAIAERTKFLSSMGHELRTPLNGIIGAMNILTVEHPDFSKNEYFQILKYCSNHMQQLINDILDFNKIEVGKLNIHLIEVNLKELLLNSTLPFYNSIEEKKLQLKVELDPQLDLVVLADDVRIIQIINNLLSNALKFTEHGFIRLNVSCETIDESIIKVNFLVEDTGLGIAKEDQQRIFEGFEQVYSERTRNYAGTGLGLNICLRLLKLMGGSLTLISEKGKGSTFAFTLELKRVTSQVNKIEQDNIDEEVLSGLRILVVEDNQINMMIAKKILSDYQANCVSAYNGTEALEVLQKDSNFNIILMDLEMPVMSGYETILHIKNLYPQIPALAFTASLIDEKMLAELIETGFEDCITKPFQPNQLFLQVKKYANYNLVQES